MNTIDEEPTIGNEKPTGAWRRRLRRSKDRRIIPNEANLALILAHDPRLGGIALNEMNGTLVRRRPLEWAIAATPGPWRDEDAVALNCWLQDNYRVTRFPAPLLQGVVALVARDRSFSPLRDYLEGLTWDGIPRLDTILPRYARVADTAYSRTVGAKFMIMAVARAINPGCEAQAMLVLEGRQNIGKSSWIRTLASPAFYSDHRVDIYSRDAASQLSGKWVVEVSELASWRNARVEDQKQFLSQQVDRFRPPYGRNVIELPRTCVFIASTNEREYLRDETGERRYWPVEATGYLDTVALERDRDALWAEAVHRYRAGEDYRIAPSDPIWRAVRCEQDARRTGDPWEYAVRAFVEAHQERGVTCHEILVEGLRIPVAELTNGMGRRVGAIMNGLGWSKTREASTPTGPRSTRYFPPSTNDPLTEERELTRSWRSPQGAETREATSKHAANSAQITVTSMDVDCVDESDRVPEQPYVDAAILRPGERGDAFALAEDDVMLDAREKWRRCNSEAFLQRAGFVWAATVSSLEGTIATAPTGYAAREALRALTFYGSPSNATVDEMLAALRSTLEDYARLTPRDQYHPFSPSAVNGWASRGRLDERAISESARLDRMTAAERREHHRRTWTDPVGDAEHAEAIEELRVLLVAEQAEKAARRIA